MLYYYKDIKSTDYLKEKARIGLEKIIDSCANLSALEPLLQVSPDDILKHILTQYKSHLKKDNHELRHFVQNGGLQKLQEIKISQTVLESDISSTLLELINEINSFYPEEIVRYYSPEGDQMKPVDKKDNADNNENKENEENAQNSQNMENQNMAGEPPKNEEKKNNNDEEEL